MSDTKDRILDVAEKLFAEKGFADTSLRMITAEAGANLASVNYHFQTKDALIMAVFARRLGPLNRVRLAMLDEAEAQAGDGPLASDAVLRAFFEPLYRGVAPCAHNPYFLRLMGRMYVDPSDLFERVFQDQFIRALQRALPELPLTEVVWRMYFMIGTLAHTMAGSRRVEVISQGLVDASDGNAILERLIDFVSAGLHAPVRDVKTGDRA
jgi:AcrR family transcriptional regulator